MKVYVLVIDSCYDYERNTNVFVYETLGAAQEDMYGGVQCFQYENDADASNWVLGYDTETGVMYQEDGDYTRNHVEWTIYEREVQPDKDKEL